MSAATAVRVFRKAVAHWGWREYGLLAVLWGFTALVPYVYGWGLFSFIVFPLFILSIPVLTMVTERLVPRGPAFDRRREHVIEFFTGLGGEQSHGKLIYVDGIARAMWVIEGASSKTVDARLTDEAFRAIWNALRSIGDFEKFKTNAPLESLDLKSNYFIGVAFADEGQTYMSRFLVPHTSSSAKVNAWLENFMATRNAA